MAPPLTSASKRVTWWCGRFDLLHLLESPSTRLDPTIKRLPRDTLRRHRDLRAFTERAGVSRLSLLAYEAAAEGPYGFVRLAAVFPDNPFEGGSPEVFALDGDRHSLHRNPPFDGGEEGVSASLCLYYPYDPEERRWTPEYGLIGLFDLARRHLVCEHIWRETTKWPTDDAAHGLPRPAPVRPDLKVASVRSLATGPK